MLYKILNTELEYLKRYSSYVEEEKLVRFRDAKLPDMYTHNCTVLTKEVSEDELKAIIESEMDIRKKEKQPFLMIQFDFEVTDEFINQLDYDFEVEKYDYYGIDTIENSKINSRNAKIVKALNQNTLKDGVIVDIEANTPNMGLDFAVRRILRKKEAYEDEASHLDLYVVYEDDRPIGNCEFFLNHDMVKIEDFDIIESHQRKGYGTSVLKKLLKQSLDDGIDFAYLITESADTAKEFYRKCGMKKIGIRTELNFKLKT
ncbi:MAG: GNAT family N-acetyltransferase [Thermotogota bacterium]